MLAYENEMFLTSMQEDGLTIVAKGLGLETVFLNVIKVHSDPGNLVLVLGCNDQEEQWIINKLEAQVNKEKKLSPGLMKLNPCQGETHLPKRVTTDVSTTERQSVYLDGGVLFITTRILVVDFLMDRIPAQLITGILVYRAHRIIDSCQESFILRLFREKNKTGFIKAFSGSPVSFSQGFCQVERVMKNLFIRHLHLWPRYQSTVTSALAAVQPQVVEVHLQLTPRMQDVQTAVLDLISFTLKELKRLNPSLDTEELTVENSMSKSFHKILQRELDPVWHQLSGKSRQLVSDLKTLRLVLTYLTQYDCITFYNFVSTLKTTESAIKSGGWVLLDSAETLFISARDRVFENMDKDNKKKNGKEDVKMFEENPKWTEIAKIIEEIKEEMTVTKKDNVNESVMIVTRDERTGRQVNEFLTQGSDMVLGRMYNKCFGEKYGFLTKFSEDNEPKNIKEFKHKGKGKKSAPAVEVETDNDVTEKPDDESKSFLSTTFHSLDSCESFDTFLLLSESRPSFIILYDCDMTFVRQVEAYQASNTDVDVRVYFLLYKGSVEEQAYLTTLRREKNAFENLIKAKSEMVVPEDREGRDVDNR